MLYKLLGIVIWRGGKMFLRRKYGTYLPKPVLAGLAVAALAAAGAGVALSARSVAED